MQIWMTLILAVQLLSALVMIGLVLIQHGKGADMGASFGSGASGSLFGATVAFRLCFWELFFVFILNIINIYI